jgi:drug/metabolite transporter (DMT)-like permease
MPSILADTKKKAFLMTILAGFLWGTSFPAIKIGLQFMDPYTFVFLRFLIASLTLAFVMLLTRNRLSFKFPQKRLLLFLGVINGVAYLLQYSGMVDASASESSLFVNLSVVWVAVLSAGVLKEHLGFKKVVGIVLSLFGVVLITTNLEISSIGRSSVLAAFFVLAAGFLWAVFIVYNKPLVKEGHSMVVSMTWLMLFTMLPLLPILPFSAAGFASLPLSAWFAIFFTGILCWVVPFYLWLEGLKHISPLTSSVVLLTEILVAMSISIVLLGEVLTLPSAIGGISVIIAILLVSLTDKI